MLQKTIVRLEMLRVRVRETREGAGETLLHLIGVAPQALSYSRDVLRWTSQPEVAKSFCESANSPSAGPGYATAPTASHPSGRGATSFAHAFGVVASGSAARR